MPPRQRKNDAPTLVGVRYFTSRVRALVTHPLFGVLTFLGNGCIILSAYLLYDLEKGLNPNLNTPLDALWWAVSTVTTVGYGDISPVTNLGKVVGMTLMIFGTALFWSFTALFATVLLEPELREMETEFRDIEQTVHKIEQEVDGDDEKAQRLIKQLESALVAAKAISSGRKSRAREEVN